MATTLQTLTLSLALMLGALGPPKDPEKATERITRTHILRVGVAENPPWVSFEAGQAVGIEAGLIREFAASLGAQVQWVRNTETPLMKALKAGELDMVAAGLDKKTPWKSDVAISQPFLEAKWVVASRRTDPPPRALRGLRIAAPAASSLADKLRGKGAIVVPAGVGAAWQGALIYDFQVEQANLRATSHVIAKEKHVLAATPGENQLLLRLDRFVVAAKPRLEAKLHGPGGA